jgi:hypothetical protein
LAIITTIKALLAEGVVYGFGMLGGFGALYPRTWFLKNRDEILNVAMI